MEKFYAGYRPFDNLQTANEFMELADAYITDDWVSMHFDKGQVSLYNIHPACINIT